jgi:hypothetical protein
LSDEKRVTYNSDKTFSVKSGMLESNLPLKNYADYEQNTKNLQIMQVSKKRPQ